jgi:hypothetical protein
MCLAGLLECLSKHRVSLIMPVLALCRAFFFSSELHFMPCLCWANICVVCASPFGHLDRSIADALGRGEAARHQHVLFISGLLVPEAGRSGPSLTLIRPNIPFFTP